MTVILVNAEAGRVPLPDGVVHCSVSSPPYFSLRQYEGDQSRTWPEVSYAPMPGLPPLTILAMHCTLGHEETLEAFIGHLVACYREVWRVSRDDSVHWIVMGDSYANDTKWGGKSGGKNYTSAAGKYQGQRLKRNTGLKQGDLMLIPHRLALALQADTIEQSASIAGGELGAAWLAGVIDCDGSMGIRKQERKDKGWNPSYSCYMSVNLTDEEIVNECVRVTGTGKVREETWNPPGTDERGVISRRQRYVWRLDGVFIEILQSIYPYLKAKHKQALLLYNLHLLNQITKGHKPQSQELLDKKKLLYQTVKGCNQREDVDLPDWLVDIPRYTGKPRWTVRNDCVWHKVASMPESVQGTRWERCRNKVAGKWQDAKYFNQDDGHSGHISNRPGPQWQDCPGCPRCEATGGYVLRRGSWRHTRAQETVLHLTKGMGYWSDGEAVREASTRQTGLAASFRRETKDHLIPGQVAIQHRMDREDTSDNGGRNPRSVLVPKSSSYAGKHYATYPVDLIRPLIKSSCPVRCCSACGSGWAPQIEKGEAQARPDNPNPALPYTAGSGHTNGTGATTLHKTVSTNILGYYPTCACHAGNPDPPHAPGVVLDPFFGSGTTGLVARELGVDCIGLDLSYDYLSQQARARLGFDAWDDWHQGRDGDVVGDLEGLPLFEGVE